MRSEEPALRRKAERLEAIASLARGVQHDINNLLTVIFANLEMLKRRAEEGAPQRQLVRVEEAARRFLTTIQSRGVRGAEQGPFTRELRELVMLIREPDTELVARLTVMQRDYPGAQLRAVTCPAQ